MSVEYLNKYLQGILFSIPECLKVPLDFVRLLSHEASRVYGDKLIDDNDIEMFNKIRLGIAMDTFDVRIYV